MRIWIFILLVRIAPNILGQSSDSLGIDNSHIPNRQEVSFINTALETSRGTFDFSEKKIAYVTGSNGYRLISKKDYFDTCIKPWTDKGGKPQIFCVQLTDAEKQTSGGYDVIVLSWVKIFTDKQKENIILQLSRKMRTNYWAEFQKENHLQPNLSKSEFDSLTSWDFGWFLLEPINIIKDQEEDEIRVCKSFSPGQKALHFFWYLDGQVTNGGFIQFYLNGYGKYIPAILDGLSLIRDHEMVTLVQKADDLYLENKKRFDQQRERIEEEGWGNLYNELNAFEELDGKYYETHERTMALIESFARKNTEDFGQLK